MMTLDERSQAVIRFFGEAIAILAGDALLVSGFDSIVKNSEVKEIKKQSILKVIKETSFYIGTENMLGGEVEDISVDNKDITKEALINLYMKKTSALICLSIRSGAILSGANQKQLKALTKYGENVGLAFQIVDDMLDIMQDQRDTEKPNYANKYGMKESNRESEKLIKEAKDSLKIFNHKDIIKDLGEEHPIPFKSSAIRNYGYFKAWQDDALFIITLDDDCMPLTKDFVRLHWKALNKKVNVNMIPTLNNGMNVRGYIEGDNIYSVEGTLFGSLKVGYVSGNYVYTSLGQLFGSKKIGHIVGRDVYDTNRKHVARLDKPDAKLGAATLLLLI